MLSAPADERLPCPFPEFCGEVLASHPCKFRLYVRCIEYSMGTFMEAPDSASCDGPDMVEGLRDRAHSPEMVLREEPENGSVD
jgi:hypothetical protein